MKTLQDIMIERYPTSSSDNLSSEENKDIKIDIDYNNETQNQNKKNDDKEKIIQIKRKKLATSLLTSITILFLSYPHINLIISEKLNINLDEKKYKMILILSYVLLLLILTNLIIRLI